MEVQSDRENRPTPFSRYIPLTVWLVAALTGLLIPLKILSLGYVPVDDAMCHVAKAVSGKSWPQILVMDERFAQDEHPGWHAILAVLHRSLNWTPDTLLSFSVIAPFVLFWLAMFWLRKRPEAVLVVLLAGSALATPAFSHLLSGRPLAVMTAVYVALLQLWTQPGKTPAWAMALSILIIAFSVWVQGTWYLYGFVIAGFVLANEWRKAFALALCSLAGTILGAAFTGHPIGYLHETFVHLFNTVGGDLTGRMLVTELRPQFTDLFFMLILLALLWRVARGEWQNTKVWTPLLALAVLGWILGFKIVRFWTDWGFPAALLWLAVELEEVLQSKWATDNLKALVLAGLAAIGVFLSETGDVNSRWTANLTKEYITPKTPDIAGWLPDKGGIVYSPDMTLFFSMFYNNPTADWRYALGFEPGIMTPDNYEIFRKIQWNGSVDAFELWVAKMRTTDRMIIQQDAQPPIPGLEWHCAVAGTWIGRLPHTNAVSTVKDPITH